MGRKKDETFSPWRGGKVDADAHSLTAVEVEAEDPALTSSTVK